MNITMPDWLAYVIVAVIVFVVAAYFFSQIVALTVWVVSKIRRRPVARQDNLQ